MRVLMSSQRRRQTSQPPKAWTGTNPITQRASNAASMPNGSEKPLPRLPTQSQPKAGTNAHADKHAHDRLLYLLAHCTVSILMLNQYSTALSLDIDTDIPVWLGHRRDYHIEEWRTIYGRI